MNRKEFMDRLERLLQNIPDSEREEALQYYNDYFDDAGTENEAKIIRELVSPEQVAQKIRAGCLEAEGEYSEQGYEDARFRDSREIVSRVQQTDGAGTQGYQTASGKKEGTNFWKILAIILLCILVGPVVVPVCIAILAAIFGVIVAIAAVCFGIVAAGFAVLIAGIAVAVAGIVQIFTMPAVGIALSGVGLLIFAVGVLLTMVTVWCCVKVIPWLIRGIVGLVSYPFRKAGAAH